MNTSKLAQALRAFAESFALFAEALEEKDPEVIELKDLQEAGRRVIKLLGAPALAKILKAHGLKNLSSAAPEDYPALYAAIKELTNDD